MDGSGPGAGGCPFLGITSYPIHSPHGEVPFCHNSWLDKGVILGLAFKELFPIHTIIIFPWWLIIVDNNLVARLEICESYIYDGSPVRGLPRHLHLTTLTLGMAPAWAFSSVRYWVILASSNLHSFGHGIHAGVGSWGCHRKAGPFGGV